MNDETKSLKPWQKGGPSPNPKGAPPRRRVKTLLSRIDPLAEMIADFDTKGTGVFDSDGTEMSHGDGFIKHLWKESLTDLKSAQLYNSLRSQALDRVGEHHRAVLDAAIYFRQRYLDEFITCEKLGKPRPRIFPDPRDIIIHPNGDVQISGPIDASQYEALKGVLDLRDLAVRTIEEVLENRQISLEDRRKIYDYLKRRIYNFNRTIPKRYRVRIPRFHDVDSFADLED